MRAAIFWNKSVCESVSASAGVGAGASASMCACMDGWMVGVPMHSCMRHTRIAMCMSVHVWNHHKI